jgi:hypothetical protein
MKKSRSVLILPILVAALLIPAGRAFAWGDAPSRQFDSAIDASCWKWNWYQHAYYNVCPVYLHPKAYMYPRHIGAALRVKG